MIKIAILGAGAAGLAASVAALKEGMAPTIFEQASRVGGIWGPSIRSDNDPALAWNSMQTNISRYTGVFTDFPWDESVQAFPTSEEMFFYLQAYAQHFKIMPLIQFNSCVKKVFSCDNRWTIQYTKNNKEYNDTFDAVIVATGKFAKPYKPPIPGLKNVSDKIHSAQFNDAKSYANKQVLVVGGSLSGTAIAEELAFTQNASVIHVFRKPRWILNRWYQSADAKSHAVPRDVALSYVEQIKLHNKQNKYAHYVRLHPEQQRCESWRMSLHDDQGFVVGDQYLALVDKQKIDAQQANIIELTKNSALLSNGLEIKFDSLILCTGYTNRLSFLPPSLRLSAAQQELFEDTFPLHFKNIAFIGMYDGQRGAAFPLVELQAKFIMEVLNNSCHLPTHESQKEFIAATPKIRTGIEFANSLAKRMDCYPDEHKFANEIVELLRDAPFTTFRYKLKKDQHASSQLRKLSTLRKGIAAC